MSKPDDSVELVIVFIAVILGGAVAIYFLFKFAPWLGWLVLAVLTWWAHEKAKLRFSTIVIVFAIAASVVTSCFDRGGSGSDQGCSSSGRAEHC